MQNNISSKKNLPRLLTVVAVAVLALIIWWVSRGPLQQEAINPTVSPTPAQDELQQEVNQLDLGDINGEFNSIDQDLNTL